MHLQGGQRCCDILGTAWKVFKYGVFSSLYFPVFGLNMERYSVSLRIQSECGKIRTRKNSVFGQFSRSRGILGYTEEICHNFWSTIPGDLGFSETAAIATNLYTGWPLSKFEPLLKFEKPSHVSSTFSYLAYIARFGEISSRLLKLAEDVQ